MNAFSPVAPFNLAFRNQAGSTVNNALISAWLDGVWCYFFWLNYYS